MIFAVTLLLTASAPRVLVDEVFEIPASQWRFATVTPAHPPARLECDFRVAPRNATVRVVIMDSEEFQRLKGGDKEQLDSADASPRGSVARLVDAAEDYAVVVENTSKAEPARVALRVTERGLLVGELSTERRAVIIVISTVVFLAIVVVSGRKLLRAVR